MKEKKIYEPILSTLSFNNVNWFDLLGSEIAEELIKEAYSYIVKTKQTPKKEDIT